MVNDNSYTQHIFTEGASYMVGTNDGTVFKQLTFKGTRLYNGKSIMVFETTDNNQLTINPSYTSFTIEECGATDVSVEKGDDTWGN